MHKYISIGFAESGNNFARISITGQLADIIIVKLTVIIEKHQHGSEQLRKNFYFLFIAVNADNIVAGNNFEFREKLAQQVNIAVVDAKYLKRAV